jgi:hypothetical protein
VAGTIVRRHRRDCQVDPTLIVLVLLCRMGSGPRTPSAAFDYTATLGTYPPRGSASPKLSNRVNHPRCPSLECYRLSGWLPVGIDESGCRISNTVAMRSASSSVAQRAPTGVTGAFLGYLRSVRAPPTDRVVAPDWVKPLRALAFAPGAKPQGRSGGRARTVCRAC